MMDTALSKIKKNYKFIVLKKLVIVSVLIGFLSALLAISLKRITEHYESILFAMANSYSVFYFIFPVVGLSVIFFLRQYLFKKKENKGIKEIFESTRSKSKNLPVFKIPSHFINGFITVIFGGSTGIEVSTVVATATIGSVAQQKENLFRKYKTELICAGVAAGITALFSSPIAGILFALEVISLKMTRTFLITNLIAIGVASLLIFVLDESSLFSITISTWHFYAIPYFIILGILSGVNSIYLTKCVMFFKIQSTKINASYKIIFGGLILGTSFLFFPQLYGEGYHALKLLFLKPNVNLSLALTFTVIGILILKPIITSITLMAGGDGGVFAPSLFIGAFLGFFVATILNTFFNANVIPINFMVIGMAAMLSASIHAPFTALFLVCGLINDYTLFLPILMTCLVSKYVAKAIYPITVYTYAPSPVK